VIEEWLLLANEQIRSDCLRIEFGARSDQGKVRSSNEDYCVANPDSRLFLVADGMGGHAAGEIASQIAASTVEEVVSGSGSGLSVEELLRLAVQKANTRVYETQMLKSEYRGMGSTLTALKLHDGRHYVAQVGDSRAYLFREHALVQLTRDHSLVWPLYESGILTKDEISRHPQKNLITRSIGTHPEVEPDIQSGAALAGDIYLLCSDGLTDVLVDSEIERIISSGGNDPSTLIELLINAANAHGGPDNVTVVLVCLR
jgi:serine/threonine protein phosphatase PrpC